MFYDKYKLQGSCVEKGKRIKHKERSLLRSVGILPLNLSKNSRIALKHCVTGGRGQSIRQLHKLPTTSAVVRHQHRHLLFTTLYNHIWLIVMFIIIVVVI